MTEEFDALQRFDILTNIGLVIATVVLGIALELGLRFAQRWTKSKGWRRTSLILNALTWQPIFWCLLYAASLLLAGFSDISMARQTGQSVLRILLTVSITIVIVRVLTGWVKMLTEQRASASSSIFNYLINAVAILIVIFVVLYSLQVSVPLLLATFLGSTLGLSFALREPLSNLFAGLVLTASQRLAPGDFIRLSSGEQGRVQDIQWDVTLIQQLQGSEIIVPNSRMTQAELINFDRPDSTYLLKIDIGVSYDSDLDRVEQVTNEVADRVLRQMGNGVLAAPSYIRYKRFGESDLQFTAYLLCGDFADRINIQHEFIKQLHYRYKEEGIVMPYPTLELHTPGDKQTATDRKEINTSAVEDVDEQISLSGPERDE